MAHFGQHWGICGAPSAPITLGRYSSWPNALSFHPAPPPATHSHRSEGVRPRATLNREVATSRQTARAARRTPGNCVSKDWRYLRALVGGWYHARPPSPAAPQSPPLTTALELVGSPNRPGHLKSVKGRRQLGVMPRARARHTSRPAVDHQWLALLVEGNLPQLQVRLRRGATAKCRDAPQCLGCRRKRVPRLGTRVPRAVRSPRNCHRWSRHASRTWSLPTVDSLDSDTPAAETTRTCEKVSDGGCMELRGGVNPAKILILQPVVVLVVERERAALFGLSPKCISRHRPRTVAPGISLPVSRAVGSF